MPKQSSISNKEFYKTKRKAEKAESVIRSKIGDDATMTRVQKAAAFDRAMAKSKCHICKREGRTMFMRTEDATTMGCKHEACNKVVTEKPLRVMSARTIQRVASNKAQDLEAKLISLRIDGIVGWKDIASLADDFAASSAELETWTSIGEDANNALIQANGGLERESRIKQLELELVEARRDMAAQATPQDRARIYIEAVKPLAAELRATKWPETRVDSPEKGVNVLIQRTHAYGSTDIVV